MLRWLRLLFGAAPVKIHRVDFPPWREGWRDVVLDFEKTSAEALVIRAVEFGGGAHWHAVTDTPVDFALFANRRQKVRFGAMTPAEFATLRERRRQGEAIILRLTLGVAGRTLIRDVTLPRDAIGDEIETAWPPRALESESH